MTIFLMILIICLAAICKAFADTLDHHFDTSIFKKWNRKYFDPNVIQKTTRQIFGYPVDGWHIANSIQYCSWIILAVKFYKPVFAWHFDGVIIGTIFIAVFNSFYNHFFLIKKPK